MADDRSTPRSVRCLIVGSGPAGYTAAVYAARALLNPVLIQGIQPGGQLTITTDVENYPGFAEVIQGPWLMDQMQAQAEHVGTEVINDIVLTADLSKRPFHGLHEGNDGRGIADVGAKPLRPTANLRCHLGRRRCSLHRGGRSLSFCR